MSNVDKLTKALLAVIAVALCMIALNPWLRPVVVEAQDRQDYYLRRIDRSLESIELYTAQISRTVALIALR